LLESEFAQILVYPSAVSSQVPPKTDPTGKIRIEAEVQADNERYLVTNPAISYTSVTQGRRGGFLQDLIDDARIRYIMGLVDDAGYDALIENWRKMGGAAYVSELNEAHAKAK